MDVSRDYSCLMFTVNLEGLEQEAKACWSGCWSITQWQHGMAVGGEHVSVAALQRAPVLPYPQSPALLAVGSREGNRCSVLHPAHSMSRACKAQ